MPRRSRKSASNSQSQLSTKSDFTVYEFAHSESTATAKPSRRPSAVVEAPCRRLKKAAANAWRVEAKELCGQSVLHQRRDIVMGESLDDDQEDVVTVNTVYENPVLTALDNSVNEGDIGRNCSTEKPSVVYPLDLWFLIGEYIKPEDVAVFARICHFSHIVVHSARFWFSLYERFCCASSDLPQSLEPDRVLRRAHGLRARVVRALYIVYTPLSLRTVHNASAGTSPSADPESLVGLRCVHAWYEHLPKCQWRFFFRFQRGSLNKSASSCSLRSNHKSADTLLAPADVMYNADERSVVLVASTPHFVALPIVMGLVLIQASISGAIFTQSLRLVFSPEYIHASRANVAGATVASIDPVVNVHVYRWWNPGYPHKH